MAAPDRSRTAGRGASSSAKNKTKKRKVNIVRAGQRATLNGRKVVADGRGNWRPVGGKDRTPVGTYTVGKDRTAPTQKPNNAFRSRMGMAPVKGRAQGKGKNGTYNPNEADRKPSVEPGTNQQERKEKAAAAKAVAAAKAKARAAAAAKAKAKAKAAASKSKPKPAAKPKPKPSQPRNAGAGNGAPRPSSSKGSSTKPSTGSSRANSRLSDTLKGKRGLAAKPKIKSDRLRKALSGVKRYTPKKKK